MAQVGRVLELPFGRYRLQEMLLVQTGIVSAALEK